MQLLLKVSKLRALKKHCRANKKILLYVGGDRQTYSSQEDQNWNWTLFVTAIYVAVVAHVFALFPV